MPIHLAPISRRSFLARAASAGAGLLLAPELVAADGPRDPNCWAFFSDIHLAADEGMEVRGINMLRHFQQASKELLGLARRPAGLFITGDCAYNSGQPGDYALLEKNLLAIRAAKLPVHIALGNHDDRVNFWQGFPEEKAAAKAFSGRQVALLKTPRANWFILDSLEKTLSTPGLLGHEQLQWLSEALDANRRKPALVLLHHNPGIEGGNLGLKDSALLLEILRPRKQVKAYVYGHTHSWKVEEDPSGLHLVNLPALAYVFREGEPSGWVLANLERSSMSLEFHSLDSRHKANGETVQLKWRT